MTTYMPGYSESVNEGREEQCEKFMKHVTHKRRTDPRYYDLQCQLKIDFVKFSVYPGEEHKEEEKDESLQPLLNSLRKRSSNPPTNNQNPKYSYDQSTTYNFQCEGDEYELNVSRASKEPFKPYLITLHDPTKAVLHYLKPYLDTLPQYHLHSVEFTYDFYSDDNQLVRNFIKRHTVVAWRGKGYESEYEKTFYGNNIRFASGKGLRSYEKDEKEQEFVRLEMLLKRNILKSNGIKKIEDLESMDSKILHKYFKFKYFNYKWLREDIDRKPNCEFVFDDIKEQIENEISKGRLYDMNKCGLEWNRRYSTFSYLKNTKYWDHFKIQFGRSSFLDGDSFYLSLQLMKDEY